MPAANERQEGGDHYKQQGKPQHWDLAVMYRWDPFQYQITKYVMRWKDKHPTHAQRLVDLKKARHFLDKYIEVAESYDPRAMAELMQVDVPLPFLNTVADEMVDLTKSAFNSIAQQCEALSKVTTLIEEASAAVDAALADEQGPQKIVVLTQSPPPRDVELMNLAAELRRTGAVPVTLSPEQIEKLDQSSTLEYQNEGYLGGGAAMFKCLSCRATFTALTTAAAAASHGPTCPGKQAV